MSYMLLCVKLFCLCKVLTCQLFTKPTNHCRATEIGTKRTVSGMVKQLAHIPCLEKSDSFHVGELNIFYTSHTFTSLCSDVDKVCHA